MKLIKLFEAFSLEEKLIAKFRNGELDAEFKKELAKHPDFFERYSPSKEFEEESGITGVSTDWVNPYPLTWQELENFTSIIFRQPAASDIINKIVEDLIEDNPELAMLKKIKY